MEEVRRALEAIGNNVSEDVCSVLVNQVRGRAIENDFGDMIVYFATQRLVVCVIHHFHYPVLTGQHEKIQR